MREILFKAKRSDTKEWVEGYICRHPSAIQIGETSPWWIHVPPVDPDDRGGVFNVDPETVGQYTGLTDKNGKKIFEGDKIANKYGETGIVEYGVENCGCCHDVYGFAVDGLEKWIYEDLLVIGNIHDKEGME